jgi:hypothetical protein
VGAAVAILEFRMDEAPGGKAAPETGLWMSPVSGVAKLTGRWRPAKRRTLVSSIGGCHA